MLALVRTAAYGFFALCTLLTFILAAAHVGKTNSDFGGYYNASALLIVAGLLGFIPVALHFLFHTRGSASILGSVGVELGVISLLWILYLAGAAALSDTGLTSSFCDLSFCSLGRAVIAFAWLGWLTLSVILVLVLIGFIPAIRKDKNAWRSPLVAAHPTKSSAGVSHSQQPTAQPVQMTQQQHAQV